MTRIILGMVLGFVLGVLVWDAMSRYQVGAHLETHGD